VEILTVLGATLASIWALEVFVLLALLGAERARSRASTTPRP
jgi:hypothetical protein